MRTKNYNTACRDWVPDHDWKECIHILTIISENGIPWCAKCGSEPVRIKFSQYVAKGLREFYDIDDINADFYCAMEGEPEFVACECESLVWQDQELAKELLADDLAEAKRQLQYELAEAAPPD